MKKLFILIKPKVSIAISISIIIFLYNCTNRPSEISEIKVADFGAVPNDGQNDTPAILSAIESCREKENVKLVFEMGTYDIHGGQKNERGRFQPSFDVKNINNLTIEGNGAELIGHDYATMFHFSECNNLEIRHLAVDWDPVPFTQGKVIGVGEDHVDFEVFPPFTAQAGQRTDGLLGYDPELRRMARRYTDHYQKGDAQLSEVIRPGVMRVFIGQHDRFAGVLPPVGKHIIVRHQIYGNQAFQFLRCNDVRIERVFIYSNPGMGIIGNSCRDISIRHLNVMIRPGSGRWMSCTADATNFRSCRGKLVMENCLFEGMGDDATNVHSGSYMVVDDLLSSNKLVMGLGTRGYPFIPEIGDKLQLSNTNLIPYAIVTVKSVQHEDNENRITVELSDELPDRVAKGDLIDNISSCPSLRLRNCTVIRSRARGFIIKNRDVIIEDCTFKDVSASAIGMNVDIITWWESTGSHDVIIRNNRFVDCRFEPSVVNGVIECLTNPGNPAAPAGVHQRIFIENNIIQGTAGNALEICSADSVVIANNIIDQPQAEAIILTNSRNVFITGNKLTNCEVALKIGEGCDPATIKAENNIGF
jgi:hypothetical protein